MSPSWVDEYLASAKRRDLSPRSIECYQRVLRSLVEDWHLDLSKCLRTDLLRVYDGMHEKYSPFTCRLNLTIMKMVLKQVIEDHSFCGPEKLLDSFLSADFLFHDNTP